MAKQDTTEVVKLNEGYFYEALDRTYCIQDHFQNVILGHPAIMQTPELKKLADAAQDRMGELYIAIGKHLA